ncbi:hypothetical protein [Ramlibacter rhizophilus]|uniref:Uncharacterized protein n=1 Tax=Ramlibacter rhizophilus TaxID=1781167 RepID=A0A4Z0BM98_9BURK|nr:hypothetical protein [Ramlibacter rhizophilus]TFY99901.1 hypothetical protein EZ242_12260 [Ramlibacter rhizophilus]
MLKFLVVLVPLSVAALLWLAAPAWLSRELQGWELLLATAVAWLLAAAWRRRMLRRQREQIESLRDSALW